MWAAQHDSRRREEPRPRGRGHAPFPIAALMEEIEANDGALGIGTRKRLAVAAFRLLSSYDAAIADELSHAISRKKPCTLPWKMGRSSATARNPHQAASFYRDPSLAGERTIASAEFLRERRSPITISSMPMRPCARRAMLCKPRMAARWWRS